MRAYALSFWYVLGSFWRLRSAVLAAKIPAWASACTRVAGVRPDGADHGLRRSAYLGATWNPAVSIGLWAGRFPPPSSRPTSWRRCSRDRRRRGALPDCQRTAASTSTRLCAERLWRTFGRRLLAAGRARLRSRMTMFFLIITLGATDSARAGRLCADRDRPGADADHLISIPVTNTSVNPARSTGVA